MPRRRPSFLSSLLLVLALAVCGVDVDAGPATSITAADQPFQALFQNSIAQRQGIAMQVSSPLIEEALERMIGHGAIEPHDPRHQRIVIRPGHIAALPAQ